MNMEKEIYTAGFFDGEGYIGFGYEMRIEIRIVQVNRKVLEQLKEWWGGYIYTRKPQKNRKSAHDWILTEQKKVNEFVEAIYPYLIVKKEQVDRCYPVKEKTLYNKV